MAGGRQACNSLLLVLFLGIAILRYAVALREGEFIPTARKAQFHKMRTHWHDLLGAHSPRYGHDRMVAIPLPKPELTLGANDDYKIQLAFNGDRHVTAWLKLLGHGVPEVPFIDVELRRSGEDILGVTAKVLPVPEYYRTRHQALVADFANVTQWPKHVLVRYRFKTLNDVDIDRGLYVLLIFGLVLVAALTVNAGRGSQAKLSAFIAEMAGEQADAAAGPPSWKSAVPKAD